MKIRTPEGKRWAIVWATFFYAAVWIEDDGRAFFKSKPFAGRETIRRPGDSKDSPDWVWMHIGDIASIDAGYFWLLGKDGELMAFDTEEEARKAQKEYAMKHSIILDPD